MIQKHRSSPLLGVLTVAGAMCGMPAISVDAGQRWFPTWGRGSSSQAETCQTAECETGTCSTEKPCGRCKRCGHGGGAKRLFGFFHRTSNAVPEVLPLGSVVRAHDQVMQTNAEASDFIMYRMNFVGQTAELTPDGKDHILEIAARMRSAPFPVIVEREPNNSDPELDALRRNLVAQVLYDLGNLDAQQRTVVATSYGPGYWSMPAQNTYWQYIGTFGNNQGFMGGGFGGGFGGGGFGGGF